MGYIRVWPVVDVPTSLKQELLFNLAFVANI